MANVKNNSAAQETRRRLLAAAGEVFAELGYHASTIKDITDRASASLASVNYHFRDKAELYAAVLRRIEEDAAVILPPPGLLVGTAPQRLTQFVWHLCNTMICHDRPAWEQVLMARELAEPSPAMESIFENVLRPLSREMSQIVAEILHARPGDERVGLYTASVLGQVFYFGKRHKVIAGMYPQLRRPLEREMLAEHISTFSLAAMGVRAEAGRAGAAPRRRKVPTIAR